MHWKLLDTGIRSAQENIAIDHFLLSERIKEKIPNTLRFLQFSPSCVLVGYHQTIENEVREEFCKERNIDINRRLTGGGAIYIDKAQLGWEIIAKRDDIAKTFDKITERLCNCVVFSLKKLGINAHFRKRNDIEVQGRKIGGTGGLIEGDFFLFQGTLLVNFDLEAMFYALKVPTEKLSDKEISSAKERVVSLREIMGKSPPVPLIKKTLVDGFSHNLNVRFEKANLPKLNLSTKRFSSKEWIGQSIKDNKGKNLYSSFKTERGLINVSCKIEGKTMRQILFTGDFFVFPQRTLFDLEAFLKDTPICNAAEKIEEFFEKNQIDGLKPYDFKNAISLALEKTNYLDMGISIEEANRISVVNGRLIDIIKNASYLLLPYCAKGKDCKYRYLSSCIKCGGCSVSEAYEAGEKNALKPITILNFNHLKRTLNGFKENGVSSYIGSCCSAFFNKHQRTFREVGVGGVLVDIDSQTCYELEKEKEAYRGNFENQTTLNIPLISKIIDLGRM